MERNHFLAVKEMKIHGDLYRRRTDIVGFVNGIPLLVVELNKNSVDVQNAYTDNYTDYLDTMLFDENLSKEDIKKIKKVAVDLLDKIKTKIAELDHWTDKQETKAEVDTLIGKILWKELPESYSDSTIFEYRKLIFEYVFMRYKQVA